MKSSVVTCWYFPFLTLIFLRRVVYACVVFTGSFSFLRIWSCCSPRWFSCLAGYSRKQIVCSLFLCLCVSAFTSFLGPQQHLTVASRQLSFWIFSRLFFFSPLGGIWRRKASSAFHKRALRWKPLNPCDLSWSWRLDHWTRSHLVSLKMIYAFKRFSLLYNRYVNSVAFFW